MAKTLVPKRQPGLPSPPSHIDWVRLAAYIDGEGHIGIYLNKNRKSKNGRDIRLEYLSITVVNTDPRLVEWCYNTFGGKILSIPRKEVNRKKHKPCYEWKVVAKFAAEILTGCLPYFLVKTEQAEIGLAFQRTRLKQGGQVGAGKGQPRVPPAVAELRDHYHDEIKRIRTEVIPPAFVKTSSVN